MSSDQLPVNDYDELSLPNLRHRIRTLDQAQLLSVLNYECAHAARVPVLEVLEARLRELERGAEPSGGNAANAPGVEGTRGGSKVQESTATEPNTPLRHGVANQTPSRGKP